MLCFAFHPRFFWQEGLMTGRSNLAIDLCRRKPGSSHCKQTGEWNAKEGLVLFEGRPDQVPILIGEGSEFPPVELVVGHPVPGVAKVDSPTGSEGEEVA